jgi:hypothetical protein
LTDEPGRQFSIPFNLRLARRWRHRKKNASDPWPLGVGIAHVQPKTSEKDGICGIVGKIEILQKY